MNGDTLRRVQLIRAALELGDVGFAARVAANLEGALVYGLQSDDYANMGAESTRAAAADASGVLTPWKSLDEAVFNPRYGRLVETMEGPPEFSLVVSGSMEGTTFATFDHGGGDRMRRRLLDWLAGSVEGGDVLDALLQRFPVRR